MKQLKQLLKEGNDEKILSYVKYQFADKVDTYINTLEQVPELQNDLLTLQIESTKRQKNFQKLATDIEDCNKSIIKALKDRNSILEDRVSDLLYNNQKLFKENEEYRANCNKQFVSGVVNHCLNCGMALDFSEVLIHD